MTYIEEGRLSDQKGRNYPQNEVSPDNDLQSVWRNVYRSFFAAPISFFSIHSQNRTLSPATIVPYQQPKLMAHNTTASLDNMNCTKYVDFATCQIAIGHNCLSKNDSNYLDVKFEVLKRDDNRNFAWSRRIQ